MRRKKQQKRKGMYLPHQKGLEGGDLLMSKVYVVTLMPPQYAKITSVWAFPAQMPALHFSKWNSGFNTITAIKSTLDKCEQK